MSYLEICADAKGLQIVPDNEEEANFLKKQIHQNSVFNDVGLNPIKHFNLKNLKGYPGYLNEIWNMPEFCELQLFSGSKKSKKK